MSAKKSSPRLTALLSIGALLIIPSTYYGCGFRERGDSIGVAIPPDFVPASGKATLVVRFLHPDRPLADIGLDRTRIKNNDPALRVEFEAADIASGSLFDDPVRFTFKPVEADREIEDLVNAPTVAQFILYDNSISQVSDIFETLGGNDQKFFSADARIRHTPTGDPITPGTLEALQPIAFATIVIEPGKPDTRLISLMPYDFGGTDVDADNDGVAKFIDFNEDNCPFGDPVSIGELKEREGKKIKDLQCKTLGETVAGLQKLELATDLLDCNDGDSSINIFEVDLCGDDIDQSTCAAPTGQNKSCTPTDSDGDGSCECQAAVGANGLPTCDDTLNLADVSQNPAFAEICPQDAAAGLDRVGDCNDNGNPDIFPGATLNNEEDCSDPTKQNGGDDIDCDGVRDFCECDEDKDKFCGAPEGNDCNDNANDPNAPSINPGADELCGNNIDEDCSADGDPSGDALCEPADADGDGHCRKDLAFYSQFLVNGTITIPGDSGPGSTRQPQPEPFVALSLVQACNGVFDDCDDSNNARFPTNVEICNDNIDNDCDNATADDAGACTADSDNDGDPDASDCADNDATRSTKKVEFCTNAIDEDCNNIAAATCTQDVDGDLVEDSTEINLCAGVVGATVPPGNPSNADIQIARTIFPGAEELCDGIDNDCDGFVDEGNPAAFVFDQGTGISVKFTLAEAGGTAKSCGEAFDIDAPFVAPNFEDQIPNNLACQEGFLVCSPGDDPTKPIAICVGAIAPKPDSCEGIPVVPNTVANHRIDSSDAVNNIVSGAFFGVDDDCDGVFFAGEIDNDNGNNTGDNDLACDDPRTANSNEEDCEPNDVHARVGDLSALIDLYPSISESSVPLDADGNALTIPNAVPLGANVALGVFCDGLRDDCAVLSDPESDLDGDDQIVCILDVASATYTANNANKVLDDDNPDEDCDDNDPFNKRGGLSFADDNFNAIGAAETGTGEICDNQDNNCNGQIDEGCDDDLDGFCQFNVDVVDNTVCPNTTGAVGDDCADNTNNVNAFFIRPGGIQNADGGVGGEICDGIGNECGAGGALDSDSDEGCDDDNDDFCDSGFLIRGSGGIAGLCPRSTTGTNNGFGTAGDDCNDVLANQGFFIRPGGILNADGGVGGEICDGIGNECGANNTQDPDNDEGCDDDADDFCDAAMLVRSATGGVAATCPLTTTGNNVNFGSGGDDCDDADTNQKPGVAETCDNQDTDCDDRDGVSIPANQIDEGCDDDDDNFCDGTLAKAAGVTVTVCPNTPAADNSGDDCDDANGNRRPGIAETCDNLDTDCDDRDGAAVPANQIDEGCDDDDDNFCDGTLAKAAGVTVTLCNLTPAADNSGDDCDDNDNLQRPGVQDICDNTDNDCDDRDGAAIPAAAIDELCDDDGDDFCDGLIPKAAVVVAVCPNSGAAGAGDDCDDATATRRPGIAETCDNLDTDCDDPDGQSVPAAAVDDGCDDDGDNFCDGTLAKAPGVVVTVCNLTPSGDNTGDDCNDNAGVGNNFNPTIIDICDNLDNDCTDRDGVAIASAAIDEDCDNDNDDFCDGLIAKAAVVVTTCASSGNAATGDDCDDASAAFRPGVQDICDNLDNDCDDRDGVGIPAAAIDELCDDDDDNFCDGTIPKAAVVVTVCPNSGNAATGDDCNDASAAFRPGVQDICDNLDNDCDDRDGAAIPAAAIDELCDDDGDDFCDGLIPKAAVVVAVCPNSGAAGAGDDCDDATATRRPGIAETCDNLDTDCDDPDGQSVPAAAVDEGCDDDNDDRCDGTLAKAPGVTVAVCNLTPAADNSGDDCDDNDPNQKPGVAETCDNQDTDCDDRDGVSIPANQIDEGCDDDDDNFCDGTLAKAAGVTVAVCANTPAGDNSGDDCDDAVAARRPGVAEICDNLDTDCDDRDGAAVPAIVIDEGCDDDDDNFCDATLAKAGGVTVTLCNLTPAAATVGDDCNDTTNTVSPADTEICGSGIDEDCSNGDNGIIGNAAACDNDNDDFCDNAFAVANATTAGCPLNVGGTGTDCDDTTNTVSPADAERCGSGVDENCGGGDNDGCDDDNDDFCDSALFVVNRTTAGCANSTSNAQGDDCDDTTNTVSPADTERCGSGVDENCGGGDNDGCDDDNDDFCDNTLTVVNATTAGCPLNVGATGTDCDDASAGDNPNATEICGNGDDDNCTGGDNDGCDDDNDDFCESGRTVANAATAGCPLNVGGTGTDCDDTTNTVSPADAERCGSGVDENCTAGDNDGCDDDDDDFCDNTLTVVNATTAGCPLNVGATGTDCDDASAGDNPDAVEICGNGDDDNCTGGDNDGCDDDNDDFCDNTLTVANAATAGCPLNVGATGTDCNDTSAAISPDPNDNQVCETEVNDATGTADSIGNQRDMIVQTLFGTANDVDFFRMTVTANSSFDFETATNTGFNQCNGGLDTILTVFASDGTTVLGTDDDGGTGVCSLLSNLNVGSNTTIFVQITEKNTATSGTFFVNVNAP